MYVIPGVGEITERLTLWRRRFSATDLEKKTLELIAAIMRWSISKHLKKVLMLFSKRRTNWCWKIWVRILTSRSRKAHNEWMDTLCWTTLFPNGWRRRLWRVRRQQQVMQALFSAVFWSIKNPLVLLRGPYAAERLYLGIFVNRLCQTRLY